MGPTPNRIRVLVQLGEGEKGSSAKRGLTDSGCPLVSMIPVDSDEILA